MAGHVRFDGALDMAIHADMARHLGIEPALLEARRERLQATYLSHLQRTCAAQGGGRVLPGVPALLETLHGREDVAMGLITGNIRAGARAKLEPHGLNRFFTEGGFGDDASSRAEVARIALARVAAGRPLPDSDRVVVVGDSERDVQCGRANRYRTVAVATGWTGTAALRAENPDAMVEDLSDTHRMLGILLG